MGLGDIAPAVAAPAAQALRYEIAPDGEEATMAGVAGPSPASARRPARSTAVR